MPNCDVEDATHSPSDEVFDEACVGHDDEFSQRFCQPCEEKKINESEIERNLKICKFRPRFFKWESENEEKIQESKVEYDVHGSIPGCVSGPGKYLMLRIQPSLLREDFGKA